MRRLPLRPGGPLCARTCCWSPMSRARLVVARRDISSSSSSFPTSSQFNRSDFTNQPFTGSYEPGLPTPGPLASAPILGAPQITPRMLKKYLDQFVVGQDRAKKVLSVAVFNHYQRVRELQRREHEAMKQQAQRARRASIESHPVEDEFPGQQRTVDMSEAPHPPQTTLDPPSALTETDTSPLQLEKSNVLLLGPSGVGKTLMAKTLAKVLSVPFSISDCTPFTQAGYIGEDADSCVQRLLAAANYDVQQAERGIIVLDEIDKITAAKISQTKDVGGRGVQQALLKIIEGTTVQVMARPNRRNNETGPDIDVSNSPLGRRPGAPGTMPGQQQGKEVFQVRTDNILFICSGAFVGLHKLVMDRISRGSIGFGQPVRAAAGPTARLETSQDGTIPIPIIPGSEEDILYKKHLPFYSSTTDGEPTYFNPLDLLTPSDLQEYGFIPELIGRIPVTAALSTLTQPLLLRVLTEPRNSLIAQYTTLFSLSGIELRFTTPALHKIAANAFSMGTGARALRTEIEALLGDAMFEAPGSSVKFLLVTEDVAERKEKPLYFARGQGSRFKAIISEEESEWERKNQCGKKDQEPSVDHSSDTGISSFQEYRSRAVGY
ncbi:hypothetical protein ASPZODRAFT_136443 [Penicilliopsis zonata CBS 506.65]|uniref:AAA+ ATPase domain-containing protein n=1 Tax=Penicilliopsis zonata CBS 506.65 TaxID=1073090 RepID=A0A1L9S7U3_9EURO|nr:hypothetical protein ASPZODRAFT_136443 [Penicilliopsis zonata CBS 506.65]OJJ43233.1 hypothetical protein ASPZODRAFT_136443 [Penicilliopsis zonata CBS 506.65]